jgi:hypothetical protein
MTPSRAAAIAAIVASVGLTAFTPVMAAGPGDIQRPQRTMDFRAGAGGTFQFAQFACSPRAADRMEKRFDNLEQRLQLTGDQKALYDTFMTSALAAQTEFADKCDDIAPARATREERKSRTERPDLLARMEARLKLDEARLVAMNAVFPDFKAFYASLSEQQQADLMPGKWDRRTKPDGN